MEIQLRFVNRSEELNPVDIVVFQKKMVIGQTERAVAWHVIHDCPQDWSHPFTYATELEIGLSDEHGNHSPRIKATMGSLFVVSATPNGKALCYLGRASRCTEVQVKNTLTRGAVDVCIVNSGKVIAMKRAVAPAQMAEFEIARSNIWVAVCTSLNEGQWIQPPLLESSRTMLSLARMHSGDIVLTGEGGGRNALPLKFTMENSTFF